MMGERDNAVRTAIKLRVREALRQRLETEAHRHGYSLNAEIINRLESSVRDEDTGRTVFGDAEKLSMLMAINRLMTAVQMSAGKDMSDRETRDLVADAVASFIKHGPELSAAALNSSPDFERLIKGTPQEPGVLRTIADGHAMMMALQIAMERLGVDTRIKTENVTAQPQGDATTDPKKAA